MIETPSLFAQPTQPNPDTQAWHALQALRQGPVCSFYFYWHQGLTHRLAARINDLRNMGWLIDSKTCTAHSHSSRAVEYRLS